MIIYKLITAFEIKESSRKIYIYIGKKERYFNFMEVNGISDLFSTGNCKWL